MTGMRLKGRHWLVIWLALFLGVATLVVARQKAAYDVAARLRSLRERHGALEARKAELERIIQDRSTAAALQPKVARLGLDLPLDTAFTILTVDPADGSER